MRRFSVNDWVVYHEPEASTHPAPHARDVRPSQTGDLYTYVVDKFWRVIRVNPDGSIDAVARNGRVHRLRSTDPLLEKAGWWRRLVNRRLFPAP